MVVPLANLGVVKSNTLNSVALCRSSVTMRLTDIYVNGTHRVWLLRVCIRVAREVHILEKYAFGQDCSERPGVIRCFEVEGFSVEDRAVVPSIQGSVELDYTIDKIKTKQWRAEDEAPYNSREVIADERIVLCTVLEHTGSINDRRKWHTEDGVSIVHNLHIDQRADDTEVSDLIAFVLVRYMDEAGVDWERRGI